MLGSGSTTHPPTNRPLVKTPILIIAGILFTALMGCSVTSLQCGVDGDSSFVNLNTTPQIMSQNWRNMAAICGFAYEEPNETT